MAQRTVASEPDRSGPEDFPRLAIKLLSSMTFAFSNGVELTATVFTGPHANPNLEARCVCVKRYVKKFEAMSSAQAKSQFCW